MHIWKFAGVVLAVGVLTGTTSAQTPTFDPRTFRSTVAGPPSRVLVLGSPHLSGLPSGLAPDYLDPLLDRLARFKPDIITVESLSGQACDLLIRYKSLYPGVAETYCGSTAEAERSTGLTVPAAIEKLQATLASWPAHPTVSERRHLAALFMAAGEPASALVQWLRLPAGERRIGDGIDNSLREIIDSKVSKKNESYLIGAVLAARLGLERVYPIDDHSADSVIASLGAEYDKSIQSIWDRPSPFKDSYRAKEAALKTGSDMLDYYRLLNTPEYQQSAIQSDFGAALQQMTTKLYGRQYVAWWETRNLRMVGNIRAAFGNHPGARVLVIVGSSHKPYFDAYLNLMHEVDLVDAQEVLKSRSEEAQVSAGHPHVIAFTDGRWWNGVGYEPRRTYYAVDGVLRSSWHNNVNETVDLHGSFVVPPLAEGHNHWLEPAKVAQYNACYLADGIFYVRDMANMPYIADQIRPEVNRSDTVDWTSAMTGFTGPGGHPVEILDQFVVFGVLPKTWKPDYDGDGEFVVQSQSDVDHRFKLLLEQHPAVVKVFLLYSDRYEASLADASTRGNQRGMDPKLLPHLVKLAHAAHLKVAAHIYSAADFRTAVAAGVDEIAHVPGYRSDRPVGEFQLTDADAREAARAGVRVTTTVSWLADLKGDEPDHYMVARDQVVIPNLKRLKAAGVIVLIGSDAFRRNVRPELQMLSGLGVYTDAEILRMDTETTAQNIFPARKIGKLADGYEANFLVLDRDPAASLANLNSITQRVKQGGRLSVPDAALARASADCVEGPP